jgi:prepilin-type processing-associated H-X9-DG protein/prepilin-type N-terminal cleavage/methylation domain-containing protein
MSCDRRLWKAALAQRAAFTIVELLVVITVIGILVSILLPAVQAARDSARRTQCASNQKQVGLALHHYHSQRNSFPPGYITTVSDTGEETGPGWGWMATTLPFIEETRLWSAIDFRQPIESPANVASKQLVSSLLCPANELRRPTWPAEVRDSSGNPMSQICRVAFCAYVGMQGSTDVDPGSDGILYRNSHVRNRDITDGTSQTIIVGERAYRLGDATWVGAVTNASMFPDKYDAKLAVPHLKPSSAMVLSHAGLGNGPNGPMCEINQFYSLHGDGVNYVFADGHVVFLPGTIDYPVYRAMATRAGGEVAGSF